MILDLSSSFLPVRHVFHVLAGCCCFPARLRHCSNRGVMGFVVMGICRLTSDILRSFFSRRYCASCQRARDAARRLQLGNNWKKVCLHPLNKRQGLSDWSCWGLRARDQYVDLEIQELWVAQAAFKWLQGCIGWFIATSLTLDWLYFGSGLVWFRPQAKGIRNFTPCAVSPCITFAFDRWFLWLSMMVPFSIRKNEYSELWSDPPHEMHVWRYTMSQVLAS